MENGLYKVEFKTQMGNGAGVVFLQDGKLWGGDAALFYVGSYNLVGDKFSADVVTNRHTQAPEIQSVFGTDHVNISMQGSFSSNSANVQGTAKEAPGVTFSAVLSKLAD